MKVLVINAGSSSIKYQLIDIDKKEVLAKGNCQRIGIDGSELTHKVNGKVYEFKKEIKDHSAGMQMILSTLLDKEMGVIKDLNEISVFGHRFVQGGVNYNQPTLLNEEILNELRASVDFAPLHMIPNILGVEACMKVAKEIPNVAVFDTGFHATMPEYACVYPIPYEFYTELGVKKYGAHGTSHKFLAEETARFLNKPLNDLKIITCHLGNGASVAAIKDGKCVDTSMGLTPLEGLMMGTRCGDLDPAVIEFLMKKKNWDIKQVLNCLNKESGFLGISGISNDVRDSLAVMDTNERAKLAVDMFCYRVKKYIGAYAAILGGVDVIVFSAGTGENQAEIRARIIRGLEFLGVDFDEDANKNFTRGIDFDITKKDSKVKVLIIPTDEEMAIALESVKLLSANK